MTAIPYDGGSALAAVLVEPANDDDEPLWEEDEGREVEPETFADEEPVEPFLEPPSDDAPHVRLAREDLPGWPAKSMSRMYGDKEGRIRDKDTLPRWMRGLLWAKKTEGRGEEKEEFYVLQAATANAVTILSNDERWRGVLARNELSEADVTRIPPPWAHDEAPGATVGPWLDIDTARLRAWFERAYGQRFSTKDLEAVVSVVASRNRFHPVRDWLESLRWDGRKRAPTWLVDVMGCEDTPYVRAVGQAWLVSAVARAYKPGCKVDTVLVLEGKPGIFKSSVLRALVGDAWFFEMSIADVSNKDAMQVLRGKWIGEFPEFDGLSRTEQAHVKAYFSRQVDTYRESYGRKSRDYPRQAVFAATTNKEQYLTDETGGSGRRMWPVRCERGDVALARVIREQLWAEASARYLSGEEWHITDPEIRDAEREEQADRLRDDPWTATIAEWVEEPRHRLEHDQLQATGAPYPVSAAGLSSAEVLAHAIGKPTERVSVVDEMRVGAVLRHLGFARKRVMVGGARTYRYVRPALPGKGGGA